MTHVTAPAAIQLTDVHVRRDGTILLNNLSMGIRPRQRWVILGPNGCGKSSLMRVMALMDHPTSGTVDVLGKRLGMADTRELRRRVGYAAATLIDLLRRDLAAVDVVMTAKFGALEPWWHRYDTADRENALSCLAAMGLSGLGDRRFGTLSSGEQQGVLLARTLMNDPAIILLDEPSARLDLAGRERLITTLSDFATTEASPPFVMVTHHVDEIPHGVTHAALMRSGEFSAIGPIEEVLSGDVLSECFELNLCVDRREDGRWTAWSPRR